MRDDPGSFNGGTQNLRRWGLDEGAGLRAGFPGGLATAPQEHAQRQVHDRADSPDDEQQVSRQPGPFQEVDQRLCIELGGSRVPIAMLKAVPKLQKAHGDQVDEDHARQADIQTPEGQSHGPVRGPIMRDEVPGDEHEKTDRQHAVDPHQGRVAVVGGELRPDLIVAHNRQVDQEAEDSSAQEVPEPHGDQEHDGPLVRELAAAGPQHRSLLGGRCRFA